MSYHPSHAAAHHTSFLNAGIPINYAHNHSASASPNTNPSLLASNMSSHSFPMAPSPSNGTPQPQQQQQQQQQTQQVAVAPTQQQSQPGTSAPPGVPDQDGLIAPPSMPLELDFDNLESASNYMHTYALSQGFDIRIQWSANNQTRICWSCYRGGFPESLNQDGTPNTKKRQIPKDKERRKRGSLKIGCPFRVQCTKNWKTGKMELRILEGRHKHQMETDRENLPSQVRRIKNQRTGQDSPGTPQAGNAAANAVAQAANLTSTPTPAPGSKASGSKATASKARANNAARNGSANRNTSAAQRAPQPSDQAQALVVNAAAGPSAHQHLGLLGTPTPANGTSTMLDLDSDSVLETTTSPNKPSFERQMLNLLGVYDRSDTASRSIMDNELEAMLSRAESRLGGSASKRRKTANGSASAIMDTNGLPVLTVPATGGGGAAIASLARTAWNGRVTPTANGVGSPLRAAATAGSAPQTPLSQLGTQQQQTLPPSSGKGSARCSNCKEYGHNRRRCPLG
ncbi:CCHC-type domain-containing protein [Pseudozyma hubeiensis]|nr:CCHC-type domain-containing protein [Pseudozyma hubeiensis]